MGKILAYKHEDLRSDPQHPCKKPGMARGTCNPSTGVEIRDRWGTGTYCLESLANQGASSSMRDLVKGIK